MKIKAFKKEKDNRYTLHFEDGIEMKLYDDVIVKYNLLANKEMDSVKYNEILLYNGRLEAYYKALRYLSKKLRSEKEIKHYLERDFDEKTIMETIAHLKKDGYLNEEIYLRSYITDQVSLSNNGPYKILQDLLKLGFGEENIRSILDNYDNSVWLLKLEKLVQKKIRTNHNYGSSKLKEKILYDLSGLGYYKWMIEEVIQNSDFSKSSSLLEKEYQKIVTKWQKKYTGKELDFRVKQKLLQKGFSSLEIETFLNQ